MFYYTYLLQNTHGRLYVGYTSNLATRIEKHNSGKVVSTKPYKPWILIHYEAYRDSSDAKRREKYLKTSQGARFLKRMLKEYLFKQKIETTKQISTTRWTG